MNLISGNWEEKIDSNDFIRLNRSIESNLIFVPNQNLHLDKASNKKLKRITKKEVEYVEKINIVELRKVVETSEQRKLEDFEILSTVQEGGELDFVQPDFSIIAIYGGKHLIKKKKEYITKIDKQLQNVEWYGRKMRHFREVGELEKFILFCARNNLDVKSPAKNATEAMNYIFYGLYYNYLKKKSVSGGIFNAFEVIDIFLQNELDKKSITNEEANELILEFVLNIYEMLKEEILNGEFKFFFTLNSDTYTKTFEIALRKMIENKISIPVQIIIGSKELSETQKSIVVDLFEMGNKISVSQSFRKSNLRELDLTNHQSFFIKGIDNVFNYGSLNLEEIFLLSINNGKDHKTGSMLNKVSKSVDIEDCTFEEMMDKFEMYLRYFINIYVEKININLYFLDNQESNSFETALVDSFPHFLTNIAFHRINPLITILTAIHEGKYVVKRNEKGLIRKVSPFGNEKNTGIAEMVDSIIREEINRLAFYKKSKFNVLYFAEAPFYKEEDEFDLNDLPTSVFKKSSLSGFVSMNKIQFSDLLDTFKSKSYSHVRLNFIP